MAQRLNVLISAYACEPNKGSEPEVGWQWALQMARFHDVTVLTRTNNRPAIEAALEALRGRQPLPKFVYHDRHSFLLDMKRRSKMVHLYYLLWQKSARSVIERLHEVHHYDLMHHVTFAGFRYPVAVWGHKTPCIWGPIGGIESIPLGLLPWRHPRSLAHEILRNGSNLLQATPIHVLPKRARATTLVLVSTPEMQRTFARLGVASRLMATIGLKTAELPFQPHRPSEGPLKLLFVGNIITLKGVDLALEALKASGTDATLTLVGSGNYLPAAKRKTEALGLQDRVIFKGRLPRQEVLELYPDYDVFLFPSLHDTGGYAVIEAMLNELPVICMDCGGPAVAVRPGCGIKVPVGPRPKVIAGLAAAIASYARDGSAVAAHGGAAREVILREYDWDKKGEQMNECYREAVARYQSEQQHRSVHSGYSGMGSLTNLLHNVFSLRGLMATLVGLFLIGALGFLSVGHLKRQAQAIVSDTLPGLVDAGEANASMAQAFNRALMHVMADNPEQRRQLRQEIEFFSQATTEHLMAYKRNIYEGKDRLLFETILKRRQEYLKIREQTLSLADNNQRPEAMALCKTGLLPAYSRYKEACDDLFKYNIDEGEARSKSIMLVSAVTQWTVAAIGIIIFLLGFLIGLAR